MTDLADALLAYIEASPTPYHAVAETVHRLEAAGYRQLTEEQAWNIEAGDRVVVVRGDSSLAAFHVGQASPEEGGFHLVGAHTDSPNLRVKPNPDVQRAGLDQLGMEVYGGVLLSTWLDRDLSLAGRVVLRDGSGTRRRLVDFDRPMMRIPNLAIHLDRTVNTDGLVVNPQRHLSPVIGIAAEGAMSFRELLATEMDDGTKGEQILGWDLCAYDVQPPARGGRNGELLFASRLDNLASCFSALHALIESAAGEPTRATRGIVLYDHEEVGSRTAKGAQSPFLRQIIERVAEAHGCVASGLGRAMRHSFLVSADMAHAVHPNYTDRHEPEHQPRLGGGPVIKINANQAYATDAESWARFEALCQDADVAPQRFVTRSDMPCGSTIGPITAAELGMPTVDVGMPMLSMHSCREMAASPDVPKMDAVLRRFFSS